MITEPTAPAVTTEISQTIDALHGQVETLQRELSQALEVWQSTLSDEKKKFDDLLEHKTLAAEEQNVQWAKQTQGYEERLAEMKAEFDARIKQTEQNAIRARAELDDAWQRDKLEWGPQARAEWPSQRRELEAENDSLRARIHDLENQPVPEPAAVAPLPETIHVLESLEHQIFALQNLVYPNASPASAEDVPSDLDRS